MKLPANPTNPYIKHNPQTLGDASSCNQGTAPIATVIVARLLEINSHSAALTWGISSGRLRNHNQKNMHHAKPSPAMSVMGGAQPLKTIVINHTTNTGAMAPPSRLHVQIDPCAKPRCCPGIQSATTRASPGKTPA